MTPDRWTEIERLYEASISLPPEHRARFLAESCADPDMRREVESLLAQRENVPSFLDRRGLDVAADIMPRNQPRNLVGRTIDHYEVRAFIGAGGMGEVYRARDSRLGRDVALKVLPDAFARDAARVSRFHNEAEVLASLNHPNIGAIYDLAEFGELGFLVLELVGGETLADRLSRGPIPLREALPIALQIAGALEAAHEKGILHRDLKPSNIKITTNGTVKVLDFGLAKVLNNVAGVDLSQASATATGMIVGTAAYMSPEQARGKTLDRASDLWAFGCVLYEMLTGCRVFEGGSGGEVVAAVLNKMPDWHRLPSATPEGIRRVLRRALQKDPELRLRDFRDVRLEIDDLLNGAPNSVHPVRQPPPQWKRTGWALALMVVTMIATMLGVVAFRPVSAIPEMRVAQISTPDFRTVDSLAMSSDGSKIVYEVTSPERRGLWVRPLNSDAARLLAGTQWGYSPFWSPDNHSLGFFRAAGVFDELERIDTDSGSLETLAKIPAPVLGGAWNRDGTIVFAAANGIWRIPASGGAPALVLAKAQPSSLYWSPQFLPDGHHFLYYLEGSREVRDVYVGDLDGSQPLRVLDADASPVYAAPGELFFVRKGTLFAQDFDPVKLKLSGDPVRVAQGIAVRRGKAALSASNVGSLIYRTGPSGNMVNATWFDRSGSRTLSFGDSFEASNGWSLSPGGGTLAFSRYANGNANIWLFEIQSGTLKPFTSQGGAFPIWSPDGRRIVFSAPAELGAITNLYEKSAAQAGSEELLFETPQTKYPQDWSPDGHLLLYSTVDSKTADSHIWALPLDSEGKRNGEPFSVIQTASSIGARFSPDGRWIAYESNQSGPFEVYVRPFPGPGGDVQVSNNGAASGSSSVHWRQDGMELFYIAPDGKLMAVPIRLTLQAVESKLPVSLFSVDLWPDHHEYVVSANGKRFLMKNDRTGFLPLPITLILNWKAKH